MTETITIVKDLGATGILMYMVWDMFIGQRKRVKLYDKDRSEREAEQKQIIKEQKELIKEGYSRESDFIRILDSLSLELITIRKSINQFPDMYNVITQINNKINGGVTIEKDERGGEEIQSRNNHES